jgi:prephenate dehydrogenase
MGRMGSDAMSSIGDAASEATRQAREAASSLASQATEQVTRLADQQVSVGADMVAEVAEAIRAAADNMDENVPQLAQLARGAADRIEDFSETIRDQSAADLFESAADFARGGRPSYSAPPPRQGSCSIG